MNVCVILNFIGMRERTSSLEAIHSVIDILSANRRNIIEETSISESGTRSILTEDYIIL